MFPVLIQHHPGGIVAFCLLHAGMALLIFDNHCGGIITLLW